MEQLKLEMAKGETVKIEYIKMMLGPLFTNLRATLLASPLRSSKLLIEKGFVADGVSINAVADVLDKVIKNALHEVSVFDLERFAAMGGLKYLKEAEAADAQRARAIEDEEDSEDEDWLGT